MTSPVYQPAPPRRRRSSLKRQRRMVLILLIVVSLLAGSFAVVWSLTARMTYKDVDGTKYYIVEKDGLYIMQDADGKELPRTSHSNNYSTAYQTPLGTIVAVDLTTGTYSEVAFVSTSGNEALEFSAYSNSFDILMYPMLEREVIKSIEVHNETQIKGTDENGTQTKVNSFTFQQMQKCTNSQCYKDEKTGEYKQYQDIYDNFPKNSTGNLICPKCGSLTARTTFTIKEFPGVSFDENMFATLITCTGYTTTYMRLDRDAVNKFGPQEYGLPAPGEAPKNYFVITDIYGTSHKVILGDKIPSDTGYYAQYEGHPDVYILKELEQTQYSYTLSQTLLCEVESYITPTVIDTMSSTDYFDVTDFELSAVGAITDELLQDPDADVDSLLSTVISFNYIPVELRAAKSDATIPFQGTGKYSSYAINDFKAESCLLSLQALAPTRTVKLFTAEENKDALLYFAKNYQIAYHLTYTHNVERDADDNYKPSKWVDQSIWIGVDKNEKNPTSYFLYNEAYQMIVEVERSQMEFLRWDNFTWVRTTLFNDSIAFMNKLEIMIPGKEPIVFTIDNSESVKDWVPSDTSMIPPDTYMTVKSGVKDIHVDTFKRFYMTLVSSTLSGTASCSQAQREQFIAAAKNETGGFTYVDENGKTVEPALVLRATYNTKATGSGNVFTHTAVFYNYGGGRQTLVVLDGAGDFYIPRSQITTIITHLSQFYTLVDKT